MVLGAAQGRKEAEGGGRAGLQVQRRSQPCGAAAGARSSSGVCGRQVGESLWLVCVQPVLTHTGQATGRVLEPQDPVQ